MNQLGRMLSIGSSAWLETGDNFSVEATRMMSERAICEQAMRSPARIV